MRGGRGYAAGLALAGVGAGGAAALVWRRRRRGRGLPPVLDGGPLLIAHRGGSALAPENTLEAFEAAVRVWGADMVELDVHATADGHCVVIHDDTVDRTTDGRGRVAEMTLAELHALDAGYRFTPDGGRTTPFRGRGVRIPTIEEVLAALPETPLTVEVKAAAAQAPLLRAIRAAGAEERVVLAGARAADRSLFGAYPGAVSASEDQMRRLYVLHRLRLSWAWVPAVDVVQVPETWEGRRIVTPRLVWELARHGIPVHVWTVDEVADMERLLEWGVDGIVTDRPDRLAEVLVRRAGRAPAPGLRGRVAAEPGGG